MMTFIISLLFWIVLWVALVVILIRASKILDKQEAANITKSVSIETTINLLNMLADRMVGRSAKKVVAREILKRTGDLK